MVKVILLFIILLCFREAASKVENKVCEAIESDSQRVVWQRTAERNFSIPLCINKTQEIAYRECVDGEWRPEPHCSSIQDKEPSQCPPDFQEFVDMCYAITPKSGFPPTCPFKNVLSFSSYFPIVALRVSEPIWIPVKRNGLDFMRWIESSSLYKEEYVDGYTYGDNFEDSQCLIYDKYRQAKAVSCGEEYRGICAYKMLSRSADNKICATFGDCLQSEYSSRTSCFCKTKEPHPPHARAEFIKKFQNKVFVTNNICNIGLQKSDGSYFWINSKKQIDYTYWASNATFGSTQIYGVLTPNGWELTDKLAPCSIIQEEAVEQTVTLDLSFGRNNSLFVLTVTNPFWLHTFERDSAIFCFTDAKRDQILTRIQEVDLVYSNTDRSVYTFEPLEPFPGTYWCEAFAFSDLRNVQSKKVLVLENENFEFVAHFQIKIPEYGTNPLSSDFTNFLNGDFLKSLYFVDYVPRVMKILKLNLESKTVVINIHFSSGSRIDASKVEDHFHQLYYNIIKVLDDKDGEVNLISLQSTQFCLEKVVDTLHWPTTSVGTVTTPKEFCFREDGILVVNLCDGNFMEGANWMNSKFHCNVLKPSSVTQYLLPSYTNPNPTFENISYILEIDTNKLNSLDVYLIVEIYTKYFTVDLDLRFLEKSLEQIFEIDITILNQAQQIAQAMDKLLELIRNVTMAFQDLFSVINNDFLYVTPLSHVNSGVAVQLQDGNRKITYLSGNWTVERVVEEIQNLDCAIWFSSELRNNIPKNITAVLTIFYKNILFQESSLFRKNVSMVYGLTLNTDFHKALPGYVTILQRTTIADNMTASCLKWSYVINNVVGMWLNLDKPQNMSSYLICDFWFAGNFAIDVKFNDDNITSDLEDLLQSNIVDSVRIRKLADISTRFHSFNSVDVLLVGKVLEVTQNHSNSDLESLATVVDNLHKIKRSVLSNSQKKHKATDLILFNIDKLVKNWTINNSEVLIIRENFVLFVSNIIETSLSGLMILESNESSHIEILRGDINVATVIDQYKDFSSSISFSKELKQQVEENSTVIITIFRNDVLFNGNKSDHKQASKIYGVVFPEVESYAGPISILHKVSVSDHVIQCSHWSYAVENQIESYWKRDSLGKNISSVIGCDFWHTTHFALLLVDSEQLVKYDVLDWITTINSALSFIGLLLIFFTAILFKGWRQNIGNQILLNFSFAIILQIITFYIAGTIQRHSYEKVLCTVIGVLLHYSIISQFFWMLTIAILQFKRFVIVFAASPKHLLLKACVCGWVFPILPVMLALVLNDEEYVVSSVGLCYPSGLGLYLGVWVPIAIIGSFNSAIFVYIVYNVVHTDVNMIISGRNNGRHQWKLFVLLFFMLGLTWMFGFLCEFNFGIVFAYLFCFTATLQGFVLFLYFIVFNEKTRHMYVKNVKNCLCKKEF